MAFKFSYSQWFLQRKPPKGGCFCRTLGWCFRCFASTLLFASGPFPKGTALSKICSMNKLCQILNIFDLWVYHPELGVKELSLWNGECLRVTRDRALTTFLRFNFRWDYYSIVQQSWSPLPFLFAYGPNSAVSFWFAKCSLYRNNNTAYAIECSKPMNKCTQRHSLYCMHLYLQYICPPNCPNSGER